MPELTDECIEELNKAVPLKDLLKESPKHSGEYNCINPDCMSDHHVKIYTKSNRAHCAKCNYSFSAIDWIMNEYGMEFYDVCKALSEHFGIELQYEDEMTEADRAGLKKMNDKHPASSTKPETPPEDTETPPEAPKIVNTENTPGKYESLYNEHLTGVDNAREYLKGRGLTDKTIDGTKIAYSNYFKFYDKDEGKTVYTPAVIFIYNSDYSYYSARSTEKKLFYKPKTDEAGTEPVYNPGALSAGGPCFICESFIDALSIIDVGGNACATGGTGYNNLIQWIDKYRDKLGGPLILSFDNDAPKLNTTTGKYDRHGQEMQKNLAAELKKKDVPFIIAKYDYRKYTGPRKDVNDLLQSNRDQLAADVKSNVDIATDPTGIEALLFSGLTREYEPIPTGIKRIDRFLNGGLIPKTLVLLGAQPGAGKTILATIIFEYIAKTGRKCVYYNYEMSREQLLARSLSRRLYLNTGHYELTATDILQSYNKSETTRDLIREAGDEYKRDIGTNLEYNPPGMSSDIDELIKDITARADAAEAKGEPAPIVAVDYLHLLSGQPGEDPASIIKRSVYALKQWAIEHNSIVFAIQAQNRIANEKSYATLDSGRDSSNLEYSADMIFQLVKPKKPKADEENAGDYDPDQINLCITKSRFTDTKEKGFPFRKLGKVSYLEPIL